MSKPSQTKPVNRRTFLKGTAATLAVAAVGIPALAKAQFDPAAYVAEAHRCGFEHWAVKCQGQWGIFVGEPDDYTKADIEGHYRLRESRADDPDAYDAIIQYLRQVGRSY